MNVDQLVLKQWMLEYREKQSPEMFRRILGVVDQFIIGRTFMLKAKMPYLLANEDPHELYQLAIMALYKACNSMREHTKDLDMRPRITAYIKEELKNTFRKSIREKSLTTLPFQFELPVSNESIFDNLAVTELVGQISKLVQNKILTIEDFNMVCAHCAYSRTYKDIADQHRTTSTVVKERIQDSLEILRENIIDAQGDKDG